jgi:hypothetical protein
MRSGTRLINEKTCPLFKGHVSYHLGSMMIFRFNKSMSMNWMAHTQRKST